MASYRFPTVFLSHGTPMHAFGGDSYAETLEKFAKSMPTPKAIIFVSAHSISTDTVHVLSSTKHRIQHDFGGFPKELYEVDYQCPGNPDLAQNVANLLKLAGFKTALDIDTPLDHGVWVPLLHLYPKGDVPIIRISLPLHLKHTEILKMGHTLAGFREEGIMLIGSGGAVHNLGVLKWSEKNSAGAQWAQDFEESLITALHQKNVEAFITIEDHPLFKKAHPTTEHFLPMLFTIGGTLVGDSAEILFRGIEYDSLSMLCFSLTHAANQSLH